MNCVNCHARLFFFNETEELFPNADCNLCDNCRKKVNPFLEEKFPGTQMEHLEYRRAELERAGITPSGMEHLRAYCAYMDRLAPKKKTPQPAQESGNLTPARPAEPAAPKPTIAVVPVKELSGKVAESQYKIEQLTRAVERSTRRLRFVIGAAIASAAASFGSLIALIVTLAGG